LLHSALALSTLTPEQKSQVQALIEQKNAANADARAARAQLLESVADAIASGSVDAADLAPKVDAVVAAIQADGPTDRSLLENLHALLTPGQRTELVIDVRSRMHAALRPGDEGGNFGWIPKKKLDLTSAQEAEAEEKFRTYYASIDPEARIETPDDRWRLLDAFEEDTFVMSDVAPPKSRDAIRRCVDRSVTTARAMAPVLTPEQRSAAASLWRSWAAEAEM